MGERVLMKGNEAMSEAAIQAGCQVYFGYPITPQNEVAAYMAKRMPLEGRVYLQAEAEVAAINMVLGAASAGVRAMTSSSSPGISLKTEGISYIAGSDLPCLIANVQRGGPGLGGIQPSQADYFQAVKAPGHGDLHLIVFAPASVQELVTSVYEAFDLSDKYRVPAMILSDGMLGQMMEPVDFPAPQATADLPAKTWATNGTKEQRKPNITNSLFLEPHELEDKILARYQRYAIIERDEVRYETFMTEDAEIVLVAYGSAARVAKAAVKVARAKGLKVGLFRPITLWPFPKQQIAAAAAKCRAMLTVELSMGQMVEDVRLAVNGVCPVEFYGRTGGVIPTPEEVLQQIEIMAGGENK
ncbi:MAG: 3-methyl-2-oxobutanoate dehydrogenase subunit VorB [Clostridia bacterium]|nr:3-methyl-2-oxobutanoate dehydrogenase subunit VorB [Clostridia bacterium]